MTNTINCYRNDFTGELAPAHLLGNRDGRPLYRALEGWTPVNAAGEPVAVDSDDDGNWMPAAVVKTPAGWEP